MQGVVDLADKLDEAGFQYQARNRSKAWKLDTGWYPTSMYDAMEDPEHAVNKWTRPYQWLRREAVNNLRAMQALARPRMTRKVLTPGQDEENGDDRKGGRPTERLARYYASCYVETPEYERRMALEMLMSWFDERTAEWMAGEYVRAGMTMNAIEVGTSTVLRTPIPRRTHGP
jgi:hypothetical protein